MGCVSSSAVVKEAPHPPEPVPSFKQLSKITIVREEKEPPICSEEIDFENGNNVDKSNNQNEALSLIFRKIGSGNKGDVFQLETLDDKLFHELQIHPSKRGVNLKGRMEDIVHVHFEQQQDKPLCYSSKNPTKGLTHYTLMRTKPMYDGQKPSPIVSPYGDTYTFASVEFDVPAKVGKVVTLYRTAEEKQTGQRTPLFTLHQCNPKVWVIKRRGQGVCAALNQVRGVAKLTCWRLVICQGEDPILIMLLAECIDSFLAVAKTQFYKFAGSPTVQNIDFPPLPEGMEDKLFGHQCRFW